MNAQSLPGGGEIVSTMVGHEFRQDDLPAVAAAPDGSVWVAWLSWVGDRDDIGIRRWHDGKWSNLQWVPNTSGDSWMPQVAVDSSNRVWVVWSQQVNGNWDIYARRFDPAKQEWSRLERLTESPLPDINPRLTSNGKGRFALVWQAFRGKNSNIFLKTFDGERWSREVRVTNRAANDWEPAVALDSKNTAWITYDSYKSGSYDVFLTSVAAGGVEASAEIPVATTLNMEARATVAVDTADRVWLAWEEGGPNWGKDNGYVVRSRGLGNPLGGKRQARVRCYSGGKWTEPAAAVAESFDGNSFHPQVISDGRGSIWLVSKLRLTGGEPREAKPGKAGKKKAAQRGGRSYWEYWATHLDGASWSKAFALPNSKGRSSDRMNSALMADGRLWLAWPTDGRVEGFLHRPIRQAVHAGFVAPAAPSTPALRAPVEEAVDAKQTHPNEAEDLRAIRSNTANVDGSAMHIVRGDFHRHTELSWDGGGANDGNLQDFYRYMIDAASMDFGASTDHQGGAWPYWWWYTQKMTDMYHAPGAYVPIFGYERSVTFPNGHRNVFFAKRADSRVTPFFMKEGVPQFGLPLGPQGDESGIGTGDVVANDTKLLYEEIRPRNAVAISHTSGTRMGTDWRDNDPKLEPVVEIFQGARTNYEAPGAPFTADPEKDGPHVQQAGFQTDGWVANAWAKGYKLGIITSSDHGSTHISYAMVYTADPSRQGILDAIRKRHTYGAMDNIILDVRMGNHFMGDEFQLAQPQTIRIKARGARPIARVVVIKDNKIVYSIDPKRQDIELQFTDKESVTGRHFYYVRVEQDDGMLAWSSPFFINYQ
jgi:hypothetical protein